MNNWGRLMKLGRFEDKEVEITPLLLDVVSQYSLRYFIIYISRLVSRTTHPRALLAVDNNNDDDDNNVRGDRTSVPLHSLYHRLGPLQRVAETKNVHRVWEQILRNESRLGLKRELIPSSQPHSPRFLPPPSVGRSVHPR